MQEQSALCCNASSPSVFCVNLLKCEGFPKTNFPGHKHNCEVAVTYKIRSSPTKDVTSFFNKNPTPASSTALSHLAVSLASPSLCKSVYGIYEWRLAVPSRSFGNTVSVVSATLTEGQWRGVVFLHMLQPHTSHGEQRGKCWTAQTNTTGPKPDGSLPTFLLEDHCFVRSFPGLARLSFSWQ